MSNFVVKVTFSEDFEADLRNKFQQTSSNFLALSSLKDRHKKFIYLLIFN